MSVIKSTKQENKVLIETHREACEIDVTKIDCLTIAEPSRQLIIEFSGHPDIYVNYPEGAKGIQEMFDDLEALAAIRLLYLGTTANHVYSGEHSERNEPYYLIQTPHVYGEILLNNIISVEKLDDLTLAIGYLKSDEAEGKTYYYQVGKGHQHECFLAVREAVFAEYPTKQDYSFQPKQ